MAILILQAWKTDTKNSNPKMWFQFFFGLGLISSAAMFGNLPGVQSGQSCSYPCVPGSEEIMKPKEHGTSHTPVQKNLRWGVDRETADRICNYNRHYAEYSGYWKTTTFLDDTKGEKEVTFYDSNTGKPIFTSPRDRTWDDWIKESSSHGWPSFRDTEVNWDLVRVLPDGETVSIDGTHLVSIERKYSYPYCVIEIDWKRGFTLNFSLSDQFCAHFFFFFLR